MIVKKWTWCSREYNKPMKSDSQRYHIGCKRKGATNVPALLTAYGGVKWISYERRLE